MMSLHLHKAPGWPQVPQDHGASSVCTPQYSTGPHGRTLGNPGDTQEGTRGAGGTCLRGESRRQCGHLAGTCGDSGRAATTKDCKRDEGPCGLSLNRTIYPDCHMPQGHQGWAVLAIAPAVASAPGRGQWGAGGPIRSAPRTAMAPCHCHRSFTLWCQVLVPVPVPVPAWIKESSGEGNVSGDPHGWAPARSLVPRPPVGPHVAAHPQ